jgi:hypothetical protein
MNIYNLVAKNYYSIFKYEICFIILQLILIYINLDIEFFEIVLFKFFIIN